MSDPNFKLSGVPTQPVQPGAVVRFEVTLADVSRRDLEATNRITWQVVGPFHDTVQTSKGTSQFDLNTAGLTPGAYTVSARRVPRPVAVAADDAPEPEPSATTMPAGFRTGSSAFERQAAASTELWSNEFTVTLQGAAGAGSDGVVPVSLQRSLVPGTPDQVLWTLIRNRTEAIAFPRYQQFIDGVMCRGLDVRHPNGTGGPLSFTGTQAYEVLKQATDTFLMQECGVVDPDAGNACVRPAGYLDPDLMERELADPAAAGRFLEQEGRRYGRATAVTIDDLQALRAQYYESLGQENHAILPYLKIIQTRLGDIPLKVPSEINANCYGILRSKLTGPLAIELIWAYWQEAGKITDAVSAVMARFRNRRRREGPDPLARFDLDPLRPLNNLLWGWAKDEYTRLTPAQRSFEYRHEYGLTISRGIDEERVVDNRSTILESFHTLLNLCHVFAKEDADVTVVADGFPVLNALRETHLILAHGAHNQFGDLPSAARAEMLIMQWLFARPEMREFLGGRAMVPYQEAWMDRVDGMKQIQGWTSVSVTHFRDLAVFGEQLLLSIRYGNWSVVNDSAQAANWARYWRPEIQRYVHAYRAATGVDLNQGVDDTMPTDLLRQRLRSRRARRD